MNPPYAQLAVKRLPLSARNRAHFGGGCGIRPRTRRKPSVSRCNVGLCLAAKGQPRPANTHLNRAEQASDDAYLKNYGEKIRLCAAAMDTFECLPFSGF